MSSEVLSVGSVVCFLVRFGGSGLDEAVEQIEAPGAFGAPDRGPGVDGQDDVCDLVGVAGCCCSDVADGFDVVGEPAFAEVEGFGGQVAGLLA